MNRLGKRTLNFNKIPRIVGVGSICGPLEGMGPFRNFFDEILDNDLFEEKSYEKAETKMHKRAVNIALANSDTKLNELDALISGDLLNQITASSYSARDMEAIFLGVYSACSTFSEGLAIASSLLAGNFLERIAVSTSSHFSSAERQYRFPLELGNQRTPTAQWTTTGAGCVVLSNKGSNIAITTATLGKVVDLGINDVNNMGAAMAPAVADTIVTHFEETKRPHDYYDLILSGDLGHYGSSLLLDLLEAYNFDINPDIYRDCGALIYGSNKKVIQGGSGAGCCSSLFCSYFYKKILQGEYKKILFCPTGALLSKDSTMQGETIPAISHAVSIEVL